MTVALNRTKLPKRLRSSFARLSALDAQELNLQALEIMAEWRRDLTIRLRRACLKLELIGGDDDAALSFEVEEFKRCCRVLGWRPVGRQGREADALWHEKRAKELRAKGRELDAKRHERFAAETRAKFSGGSK